MSQVVFSHIAKSYGSVHVIKNISLEIEDKTFVSFLGPSGCGKTTCLRMIAGLEAPSQGTMRIGADVVYDSSQNIFVQPEKRRLGMVFQSYAVWPHMNVFDNVAYPLKILKLSSQEIEHKVMEVLNIVEMQNLEKRMPNALSGGQQQRVALARGLVARPQVLLLDEPLSNLDAKLREKMRHDIRKIQQDFGITCIYVTHDQLEAFSMSDKIVILNAGSVEQIGTPDAIRKAPATEWVTDFIQSR
jgi:iron(III) transport system ATP-binding protein